MSSNSSFICIFCNRYFSTKSTLITHQKNAKYCLKLQNKGNDKWACICLKTFSSKYSLNEHSLLCVKKKELQHEKEIKKLEEKLRKEIEKNEKNEKITQDIRTELSTVQKQCDFFEKQYTESQKIIQNLAEKAIEKPSSSSSTTNQIKGNQNVYNLADHKTYETQTDPERILSLDFETIKPFFWKGQRGMAQLCTEHVINTSDGKKIIFCTDPTRKRFKYESENGDIKEDIDARLFTKKISEPIKIISEKTAYRIRDECQEDLKNEKDVFESEILEKKIDLAMENYIEIKEIDNEKKNGEYRNELCILNNI